MNNGPSRISHTRLELRCPLSVQGQTLLYPLEFSTEGPINCTSDKHMNHHRLKVSGSQAHLRGVKWGYIRQRASPTDSQSDVWLTAGSSHWLAHTHLLPAFSAPPRTLPPPPLWSSSSSLRPAQLDEPPHPAIHSLIFHIQRRAPPFLIQSSRSFFCVCVYILKPDRCWAGWSSYLAMIECFSFPLVNC